MEAQLFDLFVCRIAIEEEIKHMEAARRKAKRARR